MTYHRDLTPDEIEAIRAENEGRPVKPNKMPEWARARSPVTHDPELKRWLQEMLIKLQQRFKGK